MVCPNCGKEIKDGAKFCVYCGSSLETHIAKKIVNKKKLFLLISSAILVVLVSVLVYTLIIKPNNQYKEAMNLIEVKQYESAYELLEELGDYRDAEVQFYNAKYQQAQECFGAEDYIASYYILKEIEQPYWILNGSEAHEELKRFQKEVMKNLCNNCIIDTNGFAVVGVKADGGVVTDGNEMYPEYLADAIVDTWSGIISVSMAYDHTVGVKEDGTVVDTVNRASYRNVDAYFGTKSVSEWNNIIDVEAVIGGSCGLCNDGTVLTDNVRCSEVQNWKDIIEIAATTWECFGLRKDGTVVCTNEAINLDDWTDIISIAVGDYHLVGLKADGSVVSKATTQSELADQGQCDVEDWDNIVAIAAGLSHTLGLRADGTVVVTGDCGVNGKEVTEWEDIRAIAADGYCSVGVKVDGTVVCTDNKIKMEKFTDIMGYVGNKGLEALGATEIAHKNELLADATVEDKSQEYFLGETVAYALCNKDGETVYTYYHPQMQTSLGKDYLMSYSLQKVDNLFETAGTYIVTLEKEVVWNGKKEMGVSNIAHIEGIESLIGTSIEDYRKLEYKITPSLESEAGMSMHLGISLIKTGGQWYLTWES